MSRTTEPRVLAVASGGGHWVQLLRLRPALEGARVTWVTVQKEYEVEVPGDKLIVVPDATRWRKRDALKLAIRIALIVLRERPDLVITTGAAPGYFAVRFGKLMRARTVWLDSIANVERLSMSGEKIGSHADLWLTQWEHLAREGGPAWRGSVL